MFTLQNLKDVVTSPLFVTFLWLFFGMVRKAEVISKCSLKSVTRRGRILTPEYYVSFAL